MDVTQALKTLSHRPGVYLFRNRTNTVLYVGKAIDLSRRIRSYFQKNKTDWKTQELTDLTRDIQTIETVSEFDALLLEAKLIRQYKPKYNAVTRDDKSPLYVVLTLSDPLPRILFARKTRLNSIAKKKRDCVFGPFQSSKIVYAVMKNVRTIVPFCLQKQRNGKPCFYTHLGLCTPCPSVIVKITDRRTQKVAIKEYRKNVLRLKNILSGHARSVVSQMEKEMKRYARKQAFEEAGVVQKHMQSYYTLLSRRYDPAIYLQSGGATDAYNDELSDLGGVLHPHIPDLPALHRIEAIDVSNISGNYATGSLVVLTNGRTDRQAYRRFRIKTVRGANDVAMVSEIIARRFRHTEWPNPALLVIDGGKAQVAAAEMSLRKLQIQLPVVGLAKRLEEIIVPKESGFTTLRLSLNRPALHILTRIRDEAHRFALSYHRLLRQKLLVI